MKRNIRLGSRIAGVYREDFYELPIDSIREMISNAVCHRSYVSPGSIQVAIYDDRLEVTSPGRISPDLTMEQLKAGNSRVRNVAIGAAFQYMHIIEKWGTGIPRILKEAAEYGLREPELKDFGTSFRINIFRKPFETDLFGVVNPVIGSESQSATQSADGTLKDPQSATQDVKPGLNPPDHLREMIRQDPKVTRKHMAAVLGISERSVQRLLNSMTDVHFTGGGGRGHWVIDDE